ncbi:MAG: FAD-dependent thymidylate synthase [Candidatus Paceibacterota bacterium]|jgi:thymidylate synthase ThyX
MKDKNGNVIPSKTSGTIEVGLVCLPSVSPEILASHAAKYCYGAETPMLGDMIDIKERLFKVGHHTTMEHSSFTFGIEGVSVGDVTFGLHLTHPFYNTDQRSGRFCAAMYSNPDKKRLMEYINAHWPGLSRSQMNKIGYYIDKAIARYRYYIDSATDLVAKVSQKERPNAPDSFKNNFPKIAQEQMRMFIPIIMPTGLDYTIDLITLVTMWECSWSPVLRNVTDMMRDLVLEKFPEISFAFVEERRKKQDWVPFIPGFYAGTEYHPSCGLKNLYVPRIKKPGKDDMHPVDRLHFLPCLMDNNASNISMEISISCATMGQDQRHRTVRRTEPSFNGFVYSPPLLKQLGADVELEVLMVAWLKLSKELPKTLAAVLAPYGAMVTYEKSGTINATAHEQAKRLCLCAQEEIYQLSCGARKHLAGNEEVLSFFEPPCMQTGKCGEGARYCGRNLANLGTEPFPVRTI